MIGVGRARVVRLLALLDEAVLAGEEQRLDLFAQLLEASCLA